DVLSVTLSVLANGQPHDVLKLNILDDIPVAVDNKTANLTREVTQGAEPLTVSQPQTYRGTAVETFGSDLEGAHVSQVNIEGAIFSFDGTTLTETTSNSMVVTYHKVTDATGTYLIATTARGETVKVNLNTGNYTVEVTGQGVAINEAPVAHIATEGSLLGGGIVNANVLGAIDLTQSQTFSVSDVNENITQVSVGYETADLTTVLDELVTEQLDSVLDSLRNIPLDVFKVGGLLAELLEGLGVKQLVEELITNPISLLGTLTKPIVKPLTDLLNQVLNGSLVLTYDTDLATELGLTVASVSANYDNDFKASLVITSAASGEPVVNSLVINQLLSTVEVTDTNCGLLDLLGTNDNLLY